MDKSFTLLVLCILLCSLAVSGQKNASLSTNSQNSSTSTAELAKASLSATSSAEKESSNLVCDFCLHDGEGNFSSYDYPAPYRRNLNCVYRVKRVDDACHLEIIFHEFDLQGNSKGPCVSDYLLINGKRYCGNDWKGKRELVPFYPEMEEITFKLHTDGSISGKGFWMEVKKLSTMCNLPALESCDRTFAGEQFHLKSPKFPESYKNNQDCTYKIFKHSNDICGLEFTFLTFNIEPSDNCTYDYLEVDGKSLCGIVTPNAVRVFMFVGEDVSLKFKSDKQNTREGFNIKVRQINNCYPSKTAAVMMAPESSSLPSPPSCSITTRSISGEITSWGYPHGYVDNLMCQYAISKNSDDYCKVEVFFTDFDLDFTMGCTGDFLQAENQKYCGTSLRGQKKNIPFNALNNVILLFITDGSLVKKGFKLKFRQLPCSSRARNMPIATQSSCQFVFDQKEFYLRSPNYPSSYGSNVDCQYVIRRLESKICALEVKFNYFNVESSRNCTKDYLEINGEKYCGQYGERIVRTFPFQSVDKVLTFHSDSSTVKTGFFLHVIQQECDLRSAQIAGSDCNREISEEEFEIRSPGYPSPYGNDLNCQYIVRRFDESTCDLAISIQDFQLQEGEVCENDYLQISEERLCGSIDFGTIRTYDFGSQEELVLTFETDSTINGQGFVLRGIQRGCNATDQPPFATTMLPVRAIWDDRQNCDKIITEQEDVLYSPGYPSNYPDNTDCQYEVIRADEKYCELEITINNLHIQVGDSCQFDYFEVDGHRFCGSTTAGNKRIFTFKSHRIVINFHSDNSVNDKGFEVMLKQRECFAPTTRHPPSLEACNTVFESEEFTFTSPNHPGDYNSSLDCKYVIRKSNPSVCRLEVFFITFDVESSSNCEYDYLLIYGEKICGVMENITRTYVFPDYERILTFHTDSGTARSGFMIRVRQLPCPGQPPELPVPSKPCNEEFSSLSFQIKSDNHPSSYDVNLNCEYKIKRAHKDVCSLDITFLAFDLEASDGCQYDYLEIEGEKLCGVYPPNLKRNIKFETPEMSFHFRSDGATSRPGFFLQISQVDCSQIAPVAESCNQRYTNVSGTISSPLFPHRYPPDANCSYTFVAQPGYCRISLNFLEFSLNSENSLCHQDYLEISKIKYCGPQLLSQSRTITFYGSPREITFYFRSDSTIDDKGFYATFKQMPCSTDTGRSPKPKRPSKGVYVPSCDRLYASLKFQIISPGYPNNYPEDVNCRYTIRRISDKICQLQLTFDSFDVEASKNCEYDYLQINGQRICGTVQPNSIRVFDINDYQTIVTFHSDSANSRSGFVVKVAQLECGGGGKQQPHRQPEMALPGRDSDPPVIVAQPPPDEEYFVYPPHEIEDYEHHLHPVHHPHFGPVHHPPYPVIEPNSGFDYRNCDRVFRQVNFEIKSVNFPGSYPNSLNCRYIIIRAHENICWVKLTFIKFDVETSEDCQFDYLSINNKRICGTLPDDDIRAYIFTSDEISMYFRSDAATAHRGFLIKGEQLKCKSEAPPPPPDPPAPPVAPSSQPILSSNCDQTFDKDLFVIQSPGFPEQYPNSVDCHITVKKANKYICGFELIVLTFDIEDHEECANDYLFVGDEKMCGFIRSKTKRRFQFRDLESRIIFHSNEETTAPGFSVLVKQHEDCDSKPRLASANCSQTYFAEKFVIHSPLFPEDYPINSTCYYTIKRMNEAVCSLEFVVLSFDMEGKTDDDCASDYLEIGKEGKMCGQLPKGYTVKIDFSKEEMKLKFRSDHVTQRPGFSIQVHQLTGCEYPKKPSEIEPEKLPSIPSSVCDQTFNGREFSIRSPNFPDDYPHNTNCTYMIYPASADVCALELWFAHFDVEEGPDCSYDYFDLSYKKICGQLPSGYSKVINFDMPIKTFTFHSDKGTSRTGFAIKVNQLTECGSATWKPATPPPAMCSHCLKDNRGHITSPDYPDDYMNNLKCSYHVERAKGFCGLEIYFHDFHLQQSSNCTKDFMLIADKRYCGIELKRQIKKLDFPIGEPNEIVMKFETDISETATGFHAEYRQIPCRGYPWRAGRAEHSDSQSDWMPVNQTSPIGLPEDLRTEKSNYHPIFLPFSQSRHFRNSFTSFGNSSVMRGSA